MESTTDKCPKCGRPIQQDERDLLFKIKLWMGGIPTKVFESMPDDMTTAICEHTD